MLAVAAELFLRDGYARTSMEGVAAASAVSKRTLYRYHADKPGLLKAVVAAMIATWRSPFDTNPEDPTDLSNALLHLARGMLDIVLTREALALHRLAVSEAGRFPEMVQALHAAGLATGIERIAALISPVVPVGTELWAAEQFQHLVVAGPQHRALGFGSTLDATAREAWARRAVVLFLHGLGATDIHSDG